MRMTVRIGAAALALAFALGSTATALGQSAQGQPPMPQAAAPQSMPMQPGMMGPGMMGPGMGMGPGMMQQMPQGMPMQPGMMGRTGPGGHGPMGGLRVTPSVHLSTADVQHYLEHFIERHGFEHLQVGEVREIDDDTISADLVTKENSLALQVEVDRHTGWVRKVS